MAEVRQAAKHNDPLAGLAAYDKARHAGKPQGTCTCCGCFSTLRCLRCMSLHADVRNCHDADV